MKVTVWVVVNKGHRQGELLRAVSDLMHCHVLALHRGCIQRGD